VARLPGREPGGLPRRRGLPGVASAAVQALRRLTATTSSRDPTLMVKERGAAAQDRVGAVVERLKGWNQAAPTDPDEGGGEQLGWQLAGELGARIVPRQRRSRNMQGFGKIFDNGVN
jgi:hypothetical protein